ncbi:MAG: hypothetical protein QXL15_02705 [Candidatus Korarchaeota archaeon]
MRWIILSSIAAGIGLTTLFFSMFVPLYGIWMFVGAAAIFSITVLGTVISTFTTASGYVHPDDKIAINIATFYYALAIVFMFGYHFPGFQNYAYSFGTVMFTSFVIVYLLVKIGKPSVRMVIEGEIQEKRKETTARVIALTLVFGALAGLIQLGFQHLYLILGYNLSAICVGVIAFALFLITLIIMKGVYEPVAK